MYLRDTISTCKSPTSLHLIVSPLMTFEILLINLDIILNPALLLIFVIESRVSVNGPWWRTVPSLKPLVKVSIINSFLLHCKKVTPVPMHVNSTGCRLGQTIPPFVISTAVVLVNETEGVWPVKRTNFNCCWEGNGWGWSVQILATDLDKA